MLGVEYLIIPNEGIRLSGLYYGYCLLLVSNVTDGTTAVFIVNAFNIEKLSVTDAGVTVSKAEEYVLNITPTITGKTMFGRIISAR